MDDADDNEPTFDDWVTGVFHRLEDWDSKECLYSYFYLFNETGILWEREDEQRRHA